MNKQFKRHLVSLSLLLLSASTYAETETIISKITLITDDYIVIDRDNEKNQTSIKLAPFTKGKFDLSQSSSRVKTDNNSTKYDLVTESNQHLSPYPLTEFWINNEKSNHSNFKAVGYTHEAEITIEDGTVRKIRTLDDYIL